MLGSDVDDEKDGDPHHQGDGPVHSLPCALGRFAIPAGVFPLPVGISRLRLSAIPIPIAILYSHDPYPFVAACWFSAAIYIKHNAPAGKTAPPARFGGTQAKNTCDSVASPSHRPRSLTLQRICLPRNATKWGVARLQFRGSKNRQPLETVARSFPVFSPPSFSFSLIFKGKKERSRDGGQKGPCGG